MEKFIKGTTKSGRSYSYRPLKGVGDKFGGMVMDHYQVSAHIETVEQMDNLIYSLRVMREGLVNNGDPRNKRIKPD